MSPFNTTAVPSDADILCGRGRKHANHAGNKMFMEIIRSHVQSYSAASRRVEKSAVVINVVQEVLASGARFFKRQGEEKTKWIVMNKEQIYQKVSHAIRDCIKLNSQRKASMIIHQKNESSRQVSVYHGGNDSTPLEPINCHSEGFCDASFRESFQRNFSNLRTRQILNTVLETQATIASADNDNSELDAIPFSPVLTDLEEKTMEDGSLECLLDI
mmetsp:Transcript_16334/g.30305  ORF Transcript_16334/g.30305 Transcript_16334/m.30305 type:complete len:216 (+) Transcript_16334:83-730(+)